jgi:co-chaperonin GroES (HSP10)
MSLTFKTIKGKLTPIGNRVLVSDMYFGEQKTKSGLIIRDDDGTTRGIYPRWGKVYAKGTSNNDEYTIGDWVLVEHGRWTRSANIDDGSGEIEVRMVESESILIWSNERPSGAVFGKEYSDGQGVDIRPEDFINK